VSIAKAVVSRLARQHPHSAALLKVFVPLLETQDALATELPAPELPPLDNASFAQGKAWMSAESMAEKLFFDEAFLMAAPKKIASAAARVLPEARECIRALGAFLGKNPEECRRLALCRIKGSERGMKAWAKKHGQDAHASALLSAHLAAAAARRMERAAKARVLPPWSQGHCPICGSRPHGGSLREKEGKRFLQCGLCRREWPFSRTTCPTCGQDSPQKIELFFLENIQRQRAEVCMVCNHYLLSVDMRELLDDAPLELLLLCMMPLDALMQEKGHIPASLA
jgi:FdhE protein